MALDLIRKVDPVDSLEKINQKIVPQPSAITDSVGFVPDAIEDPYQTVGIANQCPDVRTDIVAEVKGKLQDPSYISAVVINQVADRISKPFLT